MTTKNEFVHEEISNYIKSVTSRENELLARLREETANNPMGHMQIAPEQGQFMMLLVQMLKATKTLEIGVFTGYSSLCVALALPSNGKIIACDMSEEWTNVAKKYWNEAGVAEKIDLRLGPALETLDKLLSYGQAGTFDFAFIDADKESYDGYYERALELIRPGGLIVIDNVLWSGKVVDPQITDNETNSIRHLNEKLKNDRRISLSMLPISDGLTLALKV